MKRWSKQFFNGWPVCGRHVKIRHTLHAQTSNRLWAFMEMKRRFDV